MQTVWPHNLETRGMTIFAKPSFESYCCHILLFAITINSSLLFNVLARKITYILITFLYHPSIICCLGVFIISRQNAKMIISSPHDLAGQNDSDVLKQHVDWHVWVWHAQFDHLTSCFCTGQRVKSFIFMSFLLAMIDVFVFMNLFVRLLWRR